MSQALLKRKLVLNNPGDFLDEMSVSRPGLVGLRDVSVYIFRIYCIFRVAARFVCMNKLPFSFERRKVKLKGSKGEREGHTVSLSFFSPELGKLTLAAIRVRKLLATAHARTHGPYPRPRLVRMAVKGDRRPSRSALSVIRSQF